ncbi:AraC family ligand binding domain-containing protein, partial [Serratia marcescens]|uniref:AraC family ligand binding domain-containing protein n=2 Tax=Serratia TaxID=613 RepID=UPI00235FA9A6
STYVNGERRMQVGAGDVVVINPQQAHACNPIADRRWSYIMFYLDLAWLGALQQEMMGGDGDRFVPFSRPLSR